MERFVTEIEARHSSKATRHKPNTIQPMGKRRKRNPIPSRNNTRTLLQSLNRLYRWPNQRQERRTAMILNENYIEIEDVILIIDIAARKGLITRSSADTIIAEIKERAKEKANKLMDASKYKTFDWKYGNR